MLCVFSTVPDIFFNLAAEEYLLKNFREDIFMLWRSEPSVVVGKYQNVRAEVNLSFAKEKGIKVARRFSGGGAVYHDSGNFNLTFIRNGTLAVSGVFTAQIAAFIKKAGTDAYPDKRGGVYVNGLKVSGSAQAIYRQRLLHHATLLFSSDLNIMEKVLSVPPGQPAVYGAGPGYFVKSVKSPVANLSEYLPAALSIEGLAGMLGDYFTEPHAECRRYEFSGADTDAVMRLRNEKYVSTEWVFR